MIDEITLINAVHSLVSHLSFYITLTFRSVALCHYMANDIFRRYFNNSRNFEKFANVLNV